MISTNGKLLLMENKEHPIKGGKFTLQIKLPVDYPFRPPHILFQTKIFHPGITKSGGICTHFTECIMCDQWSPAFTVKDCIRKVRGALHSELIQKEKSCPLN